MASFADNLNAAIAERASRQMPEFKPVLGGDAEIKAMNNEAPLLDAIRADTGEQGSGNGDRIDFHNCPVCGHHDCFSYYPDTNTWACFSDNNPTRYRGGSFIEYRIAAHGETIREAVMSLREATGHPREWDSTGKGNGGSDGLRLPPWVPVRAVEPPKRSPTLVEGILRSGHTALLAGKSKSGKSWAAIELSIAVASGGEWLGRKCSKGAVLYIDPELDPRSLDARFSRVADAMGVACAAVDAQISKLSTRGVLLSNGEPPTIEDIAHDIRIRKPEGLALVVVDSASCYISGDENSSHDVRRLTTYANQIAQDTGAAVLIVHHFGKGAAGDRESIDRARGSSVWGDAPDAPMVLTEVFPPSGEVSDYLPDGWRAFVLEAALREYEPMEPLHIVYGFPLHRIDVDGITADWKPKSSAQAAGRSSGEASKAKVAERATECELALLRAFYLEGIGAEGMEATRATEVCSDHLGRNIKVSTVKEYVNASNFFDVWQKNEKRWLVVPSTLPHRAEEPPEQPALSV